MDSLVFPSYLPEFREDAQLDRVDEISGLSTVSDTTEDSDQEDLT